MEGFKKLKSGALVPCAVVGAVMSDLTRLFCTDPVVVRSLITKAFDPASPIDDTAWMKLATLRYINSDDAVPEDARQVIISSVGSPDDACLNIDNPVAC